MPDRLRLHVDDRTHPLSGRMGVQHGQDVRVHVQDHLRERYRIHLPERRRVQRDDLLGEKGVSLKT